MTSLMPDFFPKSFVILLQIHSYDGNLTVIFRFHSESEELIEPLLTLTGNGLTLKWNQSPTFQPGNEQVRMHVTRMNEHSINP